MKLHEALQTNLEDGLNGIRRKEWENVNDYVCIKDGLLSIYTEAKFHHWIISIEDLEADDWEVI